MAGDRPVDGLTGTVGIIGSVTRPFCQSCDRVRLTSDGQLRNCLFAKEESDLRGPMRSGADDDALVEIMRRRRRRKVDKISDSGEDSLTIFVSNMKYGYLNSKTGVIAIKAVFNYAWDFDYQSGLAAVVQNDQIGFIDCFGKYAITPQYKYDELNCHEDIMFSGGYCLIPDGKGRIGVINTDNQIVLPAIYSRIEKTFFGYSILVINEKFGLADSCFQIMIKPEHDYIALNHQGIVISDYRADKQYMLAYDYKTVITQYVFDNIEKIIIDTKQYEEDEENECLSYKHSGYSKFTINGKCGVIHDKSGTIIISAKWDDIQYHDVGVFLSVLDDCYFLINIKGEIIN